MANIAIRPAVQKASAESSRFILLEEQTTMRATRNYVISATHEHWQLQRSYQFVVDLLDANKISDGGRVGRGNFHSLSETHSRSCRFKSIFCDKVVSRWSHQSIFILQPN
ncbi:hypothetical protein EVAR_29961_1 [Eumeta japonica]|uniref:Uncharacterized protein n=1 Tax=Eumeta variegata TaxID=151549 RepID=A0A4C1VGL1_EUMVA|nr:hypothetical protein EVAR_29961_1 [Eumeta japonica]